MKIGNKRIVTGVCAVLVVIAGVIGVMYYRRATNSSDVAEILWGDSSEDSSDDYAGSYYNGPSESNGLMSQKTDSYNDSISISSSGSNYQSYDYDDDYVPEGENYEHITETGFVSAKTTPLSTVSADVDTAGYANLRRYLNDGYIPANDTVRIEEMINYFKYDYAGPTSGLFSQNVAVADCPWNDNTKLVSVGYATPAAYTFAKSKGSNIVFLVDISGSMANADKLDLFKQSMQSFMDNSPFKNTDTISIVTYASSEKLVLDGVRATDSDKIMQSVNALNADGSTNGERGLEMAYEVALKHFIDGGVNRIVMVTDGDLNVGMSSVDEMYEYVTKKRETGIYLSVLGFGTGNLNDYGMETLADNGNGSYHYIDSISEARKVLVDDLMANFVPLASDVKIQVEFNPETVKGYRLIGYENRVMDQHEFLDDAADAGEVGPGHQFTMLYEVALTGSKQQVTDGEASDKTLLKHGLSNNWMRASMRYKPVDNDEIETAEVEIGPDSETGMTNNLKLQSAVAEFGMILRESEYKGTSTTESVKELLKGYKLDELSSEFLDLVTRYEAIHIQE